MYSLIWVGWVLVELFVENHQILRFSGRDWIFFCQCCYFDEWKCGSILKFVGKGCRGGVSNYLIKYLKFECKYRKRTGDFPEWSVDNLNDVPHQDNGCDYGMFN